MQVYEVKWYVEYNHGMQVVAARSLLDARTMVAEQRLTYMDVPLENIEAKALDGVAYDGVEPKVLAVHTHIE